MIKAVCLMLLFLSVSMVHAAHAAHAGDVEVVKVHVSGAAGSYRFSVTLKHADTGWDHYANEWQVVSVDGKQVYGTRTLFHPHVNEQPFTRSLSGVRIPKDVVQVAVRGRDSVHGYSALFPVQLSGGN